MNAKATARVPESPTLEQRVHDIQSRDDFVHFVRSLVADLKDRPGQWPNQDLPSFLDGLAAWVEDMDGYFKNMGEPVPLHPSWKTLGQMLLAARVYE